MTDLKANNTTPISSMFDERILYEFLSFSHDGQLSADNPVGVKSYWLLEDSLYGKVDKSFKVIQPKKNLLVPISDQDKVFYALPDVASSFLKFQSEFKIAAKSGRLSEDNYLNSPAIFRAFVDADNSYNDDLTENISFFNSMLLSTSKTDDIKNIKDYAREFFNQIFGEAVSIFQTKTSYILSNNVGAMNSGLSIEISNLNPADNSDKQSFIQSPNFEFYRQSAVNNGFLIDKNIPWRLNFDLSSPVNKVKIRTRPTTDVVTSYLISNFTAAYLEDLDYLISTVVVGYNSLVNQRNYYRVGKCKYSRSTIQKGKVLDSELSRNYWIKRLCQVKNFESGMVYSESEIEKIIRYANDLGNGDLRYVDSKFRLPFLFEGSTVYETLKKFYLEKNNFSLDNFAEHVKIVIKNSINKTY